MGILLLVLVGLESAYREVRSNHPVTGAEWIWQAGELPREARPATFFAVRDFSLEAVPDRARLLIVADEEYRVTLNGRFLGGNRYWPGMPLDRYDVSDLLVAGSNRLVVQLRSARGGGGLLASLQEVAADGETRSLIQSDTTWGVASHLDLGEVRGWQPFTDLEPPRSWGEAPVGRWGRPRLGPERQLPALLGARPARVGRELPSRPGEHLVDWGRPVTGYLTLELAAGSPRLGKVFLGEEGTPEQREIAVIAGDRELRWRDARPQRFRYARISGLPGLVEAFVEPAGEGELPQAPSKFPSGLEALAPSSDR